MSTDAGVDLKNTRSLQGQSQSSLRLPKSSFPNLIMRSSNSSTPSTSGSLTPVTPIAPYPSPSITPEPIRLSHDDFTRKKRPRERKTGFIETIPELTFERKLAVSFSRDLGNSPNNYKERAKTGETRIVPQDLFHGDVNLRDIKIEIQPEGDGVLKVVPRRI